MNMVGVDKEYGSPWDAEAGDGAVLRGLVREQQRGDGVETKGLFEYALEVREVAEIRVLDEAAIMADQLLYFGSGFLQ